MDAFSSLGSLVFSGGTGAALAYGLFNFLGKGWIEHQLAKDLENAKSEISLLATRKMKLHDREYEIFPELWTKLNTAVVSLHVAIVGFRELPNLDHMPTDEFKSWMSRAKLLESEKYDLGIATNKNKEYSRILDWRDLTNARNDYMDFYSYLQNNRIFLNPELKVKFDKIEDALNASWIDKRMDYKGFGLGTGASLLRDAYEKYNQKVKPLMAEIEDLVQAKLFPDSRVQSSTSVEIINGKSITAPSLSLQSSSTKAAPGTAARKHLT